MRRGLWWALLAVTFAAPLSAQATIAVDSEVVILRVFNRKSYPVTVFLTPVDEARRRVSEVLAQHEGFLVLTSVALAGINAFSITVEGADPKERPYRTGVIQRLLGKLAMVYIDVGEVADSTSKVRT